MHIQVLEDGYAVRVSDYYMYQAASREVMNKWAYPFCPDRAWSSHQDKEADVNFGNKYIVPSKKLSRSVYGIIFSLQGTNNINFTLEHY